jgi:hypothetical protein
MGNKTVATKQVNTDDNGKNKRVREVTESVEDAVAYPVLTEQVSFPTSGGGSTAGVVSGGAGTGLDSKAALAIGSILGWKVNPSDPKGFIGSLAQACTIDDVEGHVEATWNPRTYAIQTDLGGGITGAQASLYTRAQDAIQQSLKLLDGLYPLDPDADPEYVKALREMAKSQMNQVLSELGALGGPSVLRVNTYFNILLGQGQATLTSVQFDPDKIQGTLGTLRNVYGIYFSNNPFLNSIEDEQDITNFRVISDYITSLLQSWISNYNFFLLGGKGPAFFGTQLVLISRQFSVIAETVNEVRFAMDSVFIGPAERQTLLLEFENQNPPAMFVEDILQEIQDFVSSEGPRLLQDGGKISIPNNILPVMKTFRELVRSAHKPANFKRLPDGYRTVRVQRALDDLRDQVVALIKLAEPVGQNVPPPLQEPERCFDILSVTPDTFNDYTGPVTIIGSGFYPGIQASFNADLVSDQPGTTTFLSQNMLVASAESVSAPTGLVLTNPDGKSVTYDFKTLRSTRDLSGV